MKPIKFLLSLCVVLMVAAGAWGQVITDITPIPNPSGPLCVGAAVTLPTPTVTTTGTTCDAVTLQLRLINVTGTTVYATVDAGTVVAPSANPQIIIPASAAGQANVFVQYYTDGTGTSCDFSLASAAPGFAVAPNPVPTGASLSPSSVCRTAASTFQTITPVGTCATGTLKIYPDNTTAGGGLATWSADVSGPAGGYTLYLGCDDVCETTPSSRVAVVFTILAAPTIGNPGSVPTAGCIGVLPTLTGATCSTGATGVLVNSSGVELTAADFGTAGVVQVWTACKDNVTGCKTFPANILQPTNGGTYTVVATPTLTLGTIYTTSPASAPATPGTTATICANNLTGSTLLNFGGTCSVGNLTVWNAATGGSTVGGASAAPATSTDYWVSCVEGACEGPRTKMSYVVSPTPVATATATPLPALCVGIPYSITAATYITCSVGTPKVEGQDVYSSLPAAVGPYSLNFACVTADGCVSASLSRSSTVNAQPAAPTSGTLNVSGNVCQNSTLSLSIQSHNCATSEVPFVSNSITGSPVLAENGATFLANTATLGTLQYYLFCKNAATGCYSASLALAPLVVNVNPIAPFNVSMAQTNPAPCPANLGTISFTATCSGVGETMDIYSVATGGTILASISANPNSPTTLLGFTPASITTTYYVECKQPSTGCTSTRVAAGTFTVAAFIPGPVATATAMPVLCAGTPFSLVAADYVTCSVGTPKAEGQDVYNSLPAAAGPYSISFTCSTGGDCISASLLSRSGTVNAQPATPTSGTLNVSGNVCQNSTLSLSIKSHNCATSEVPFVSTSTTGSPVLAENGATFLANTATLGTLQYYLFCKNAATSCISGSLALAPLVVNVNPITPFNVSMAQTNPAPCPANLGTIAFTATCSGVGETMDIYSAATGGTILASISANPNAPTTLSGFAPASTTTTYYLECKQPSSGCTSTRVMAGTFTVAAVIPVPVATAAMPVLCAGTPFSIAAADYVTCSVGTPKAEGQDVYSSLPAAAGPYSISFTCSTGGGCISASLSRSGTVNSQPATPTSGTLNISGNVCQNSTLSLSIKSHNCATSEIPFVSTSTTGSPVLAENGATFLANTATLGTLQYYLFCKNAATGCISGSLALAPLVVNVNPITPFNVSMVQTNPAPCPANLGTISFTATCSGVGETMDIYSAATGGTILASISANPNAPTTLSGFTPASTTTTYYLECKQPSSGCASTRVMVGTFTVAAVIPVPVATATAMPVLCAGTPFSLVAANYVTCSVGTPKAEGQDVYNSLPAAAGPYTISFTCSTGGGCISLPLSRSGTVNPQPAAPTSGTLNVSGNVCKNSTLNLSIQSHTCATSEIPFVSSSTTGSPVLAENGDSFLANTSAAGTLQYYLFCKDAVTGCISGSYALAPLTVNVNPIAPFNVRMAQTVAAPCPTNLGTIAFTATCAGVGETMDIYSVATGGTILASIAANTSSPTTLSGFTPASSTTTYYVECKQPLSGCSSTRVMIGTFTVDAVIPAPTVKAAMPALCVGTPFSIAAADYVTCSVGTPKVEGQDVYSSLPAAAGSYSVSFICTTGPLCVSSSLSRSGTVNAQPAAPTSGTLNVSGNVCQNSTLSLSIKSHNCATSEIPFVSTSITGSPVLAENGVPFLANTSTLGTLQYYLFCKNAATGCASPGLALAPLVVNVNPIAPFNVSMEQTVAAPCPTNLGTITFTATCSGVGETMDIYSVATGGTIRASISANPNAPTTLSGFTPASSTTTYYVECKQPSSGCASTRVAVGIFTVDAVIPAPTVKAAMPALCVGTPFSIAAADYVTCSVGTPKVEGQDVYSSLPAAAGPYSVSFICTTGPLCVSSSLSRSGTVNAQPAAPTSGTLNVSGNVCQNSTLSLSIQSHNCATSEVPFVSSSITGSPVLAENGTTFLANTATLGTLQYYLFCKNAATGCASPGLALAALVVNVNPITPFNVRMAQTNAAPCPTNLGTIAFTATCAGVGETMDIYSAATGGTILASISANPNAPTTLSGFTPASTTTTYYVECKQPSSGCTSTRVMVGTFTVAANIPAPTATGLSPDKVCQTPTASIITISPLGTCASGNVRLYMDQTTVGGGVSSTTANAGGLIGSYDFYLGCVNGSCETLPAERVKVTFRINTTPATPTLTPASTTNVCFGTPVTLTAAGCAATDTLKIWSSNAAGSTLIALQKTAVGATTTVDVTPAAGATTYYVARCVNTNCSSPSSTSASVQVRAAVTAPTSGTLLPSSACASDPSVTMTTNTTCGSLATIWYTQATGGTPIASLPTTTPTTVGVTTYYAACRNLETNCESTTRYALTFTLNPAGSAPVGASLTPSGTVCGTGNVPITLASACPAGETMLVSVDGAPYSEVIPTTQMADGSNHIYRVRCQAGTGATACVGPESSLMVLRINAAPAAPVASLFINGQAPTPICTGGSPLVLTSNTNCGSNQTVWFDASNNTQLASLPTTTSTTPGTYSYFARCLGVGGCTSANSNTVSYSVLPVLAQPTVTSSSTGVVCAGTSVTFSQNCAAGSTPQWSTGATTATISLTLQSGGSQVVSVKCIQSGYCDSPVSAQVSASWSSTFDVTLINVGSSQAAIKGISGTPKSAWASQFITVDAGPSLAASSQGNPSIYYTENINKSAPRYWTAHVETCNLGTEGSVGFDMLCTPEIGLPLSFNTIENYAPYLMYANRDGFTELYAQNNPFFGFYAADPIAPGKNTYDSGFPKGLYKLSVRYWSQKGLGIAPAVRTAQGKELAYAEYYFRIQSRNGIGAGAAREGVSENTEAPFVTMGQNPVTRTLSLTINGAKGQEVKLNLVDASGRSIKASSVTPETNTHREEIDMTSQNTGMYFIQVSTPSKRASLKVLKVSQD